jgi:hypothetical protein
MSIVAAPSCRLPEPENVLWKNLRLEKLESLLSERSLYFARLDRFNESDRYDGFVMPGVRKRVGPSVPSRHVINGIRVFQGMGWVLDESDVVVRARIAACCWSARGQEDDDLWGLSSGGRRGLAISTTWQRLRESLVTARELHAGLVDYVDPEAYDAPPLSLFRPPFIKSIHFKHEQELRLLVSDWPGDHGPILEAGFTWIDVALERLIERIVVHPGADDEFLRTVEKACTHAGLDILVSRSMLPTPEFGAVRS